MFTFLIVLVGGIQTRLDQSLLLKKFTFSVLDTVRYNSGRKMEKSTFVTKEQLVVPINWVHFVLSKEDGTCYISKTFFV